MKQLVKPSYGGEASAGACLYMAQLVVGASGGPYSATVAANATKYRHHDRAFPRSSIAVAWFSHLGTYTDYRNNERRYEDWGHVVIWDPTAFDGAGGFFSSRRNGNGPGEWFRTIGDVEAAFSAVYRFWSEDLNQVRVCEPLPTGNNAITNKPAPTPAHDSQEEDMARNSGIYWPVRGKKNTFSYATFNMISGFWAPFGAGEGEGYMNGKYTNGLSVALDTPPWTETTEGHAKVIEAACAAVRANKA